jgi:hypothetical protein
MFVYDSNNNPIWYTATLNSPGTLNWSGDLYVTHGPWFGTGTFNSALVGLRKVGTMNWFGQFVNNGTLTYSVDGVAVSKNIQRQTLVNDDFSGTYIGGIYLTATGCFNPANNLSGDTTATITVTESGPNVQVLLVAANGTTVTTTGALTQAGQFGNVVGTYITPASGEMGNAILFEMNVQQNSFTTRYIYNSTNNGCQSTGYFGGIRHR